MYGIPHSRWCLVQATGTYTRSGQRLTVILIRATYGSKPSCLPVRVFAYDGITSTTTKTVIGVLGYADPVTGNHYMLGLHHAILVPKWITILIALMQLRDNGNVVSEEPKQLVLNPTINHRNEGYESSSYSTIVKRDYLMFLVMEANSTGI